MTPPSQSLLRTFRSALAAFAANQETLQILQTITRRSTTFSIPALGDGSDSDGGGASAASITSTTTLPTPSRLFVLDSSFNPPTRAHAHIALSALLSSAPESESTASSASASAPAPAPTASNARCSAAPKRLLLLLATQNADKAPKPAPFEHRLVMMSRFAEDLLEEARQRSPSSSAANGKVAAAEGNSGSNNNNNAATTIDKDVDNIAIDIGITSLPYFVEKSLAISSYALYNTTSQNPIPQIHLTGYDTLIRILSPKYYPPHHTLSPLSSLFAHHYLRVTYRTDDAWQGRAEQDAYLRNLAEGGMEGVGGRREWAGRIQLVEDMDMGGGGGGGKGLVGPVSSTRVREAVGRMRSGGREEEEEEGERFVRQMCTQGVAEWVLGEGLYTEETETEKGQ